MKIIYALAMFILFSQGLSAEPEPVDNDIVVGDRKKAPVKIYEYSSLTCPYCADFHAKLLPLLKAKYIDTGRAVLIFKHFPLDALSMAAAIAINELQPSERYTSLSALYATQKGWIGDKYITEISSICNLNLETLKAAIDDKAKRDNALKDRMDAQTNLQVDGAPTFFINGKKITGALTEQVFSQAIEEAERNLI